jgi:hypothetical protein
MPKKTPQTQQAATEHQKCIEIVYENQVKNLHPQQEINSY